MPMKHLRVRIANFQDLCDFQINDALTAFSCRCQLQSFPPQILSSPRQVDPWYPLNQRSTLEPSCYCNRRLAFEHSIMMNGLSTSPATWQEARTAEGKVYYYNVHTKATQWTKPIELMTPVEVTRS